MSSDTYVHTYIWLHTIGTLTFEIREEIFVVNNRGKPRYLLLGSVLVFTPYGRHKAFVFSTCYYLKVVHPVCCSPYYATKTNPNTYTNTYILKIPAASHHPHQPPWMVLWWKQVLVLLINCAFRFCWRGTLTHMHFTYLDNVLTGCLLLILLTTFDGG